MSGSEVQQELPPRIDRRGVRLSISGDCFNKRYPCLGGNEILIEVTSKRFLFRKVVVKLNGEPMAVTCKLYNQQSVFLLRFAAIAGQGSAPQFGESTLLKIEINPGTQGFALSEEGVQAGLNLTIVEDTTIPSVVRNKTLQKRQGLRKLDGSNKAQCF